jgi:P27 family predicted phage terminase small subunit
MGIPGRKPDVTTAALNAGHRPARDPSLANGDITELDAPADLSKEALEVWDVIVPDLIEHKLLRASDVPLVIEFAEAIGHARKFRKMMDMWQDALDEEVNRGIQIGEDPKDFYERINMLSQAIKRERAGYVATLKAGMSLASEFGLSPVARVRLGLGKLQGQSLLAALDQRKTEG